jgi:hypothetical protein
MVGTSDASAGAQGLYAESRKVRGEIAEEVSAMPPHAIEAAENPRSIRALCRRYRGSQGTQQQQDCKDLYGPADLETEGSSHGVLL